MPGKDKSERREHRSRDREEKENGHTKSRSKERSDKKSRSKDRSEKSEKTGKSEKSEKHLEPKDHKSKDRNKSKGSSDGKHRSSSKHKSIEKQPKQTNGHAKEDPGEAEPVQTEPLHANTDAFNYDEDDFEAYEDDFEEFEEEEETAEEQRDKPIEMSISYHDRSSNDRQKSDEKRHEPDKPVRAGTGTSGSGVISFAGATSTDANSLGQLSHAKRRMHDLQKLIEMDQVLVPVLDLLPSKSMTNNNMATNRLQAQTQTGDDVIERDVQTEDIDLQIKWTQNPAAQFGASGADSQVNAFDQQQTGNGDEPILFHDSKRLMQFFASASQLVIDLLLEESAHEQNELTQTNQQKTTFSTAQSEFGLGPLVNDALTSATDCAYDVNNNILILHAVHIKQSPLEELVEQTLICCWAPQQTLQRPLHLLHSTEKVTCVCSTADRHDAVFAGLENGSISAWSLSHDEVIEEESSINVPWKDGDIRLRACSYQTSLSDLNTNTAPMLSIQTMKTHGTSTDYVVSGIDANGVCHVWTVLNQKPNLNHLIDQSDLGLTPGARLTLRKRTGNESRVNQDLMSYVFCAHLNQADIYLGTDLGYILHRKQQKSIRQYANQFECPSDVICMDTSLVDDQMLISGSADGQLSIFTLGQPRPLQQIQVCNDSNVKVQLVACSLVNRALIFTVHSDNQLRVWKIEGATSLKCTAKYENPRPISNLRICKRNDNDLVILGDVNGLATMHLSTFQ